MRIFKVLIICFLVLGCKSENEKPMLEVMTYNIRLDTASDGENAWPNRKEVLSSQILFLTPDILGVQEALPNQMTYLKNTLKDYKTIGVGRDGGDKGEFSAIFYNSQRVKVESEATFWLSETPSVVSKSWDAAYPRICTYGLFTLLENNKKVWIFNTHFDHIGQEARLQSSKLILEKIKTLNTDNLPVIVMGDLNIEPDSQLIANLKQELNDSKNLAKIVFGSNGTFNGFKHNEPVSRRIDYIMVSKSNAVVVEKYGVLSSLIDLKYPSDHFPVFVQLQLK